MQQQPGTQVTCPNCRQPFTVRLEQIIDDRVTQAFNEFKSAMKGALK